MASSQRKKQTTIFTQDCFNVLSIFRSLETTDQVKLLSHLVTSAQTTDDRLSAFALCSRFLYRTDESSPLVPIIAEGLLAHASPTFEHFPEATCAGLMGALLQNKGPQQTILDIKLADALFEKTSTLYEKNAGNALFSVLVPLQRTQHIQSVPAQTHAFFGALYLEKFTNNKQRFANAWAHIFMHAPMDTSSALSETLVLHASCFNDLFPKSFFSVIKNASRNFDGKILSWKIPKVPFPAPKNG